LTEPDVDPDRGYAGKHFPFFPPPLKIFCSDALAWSGAFFFCNLQATQPTFALLFRAFPFFRVRTHNPLGLAFFLCRCRLYRVPVHFEEKVVPPVIQEGYEWRVTSTVCSRLFVSALLQDEPPRLVLIAVQVRQYTEQLPNEERIVTTPSQFLRERSRDGMPREDPRSRLAARQSSSSFAPLICWLSMAPSMMGNPGSIIRPFDVPKAVASETRR